MTAPPLHAPDPSVSQVLIKLGEMSAQLAAISEQLKSIPDHEARLRKLEAWRYGLPLAGVMAVGSMGLTVYELLHR